MAGRKEKVMSSSAVAIMAVVALLAAAAEAGTTCNVDAGAVINNCKSACSSSWWWGGGGATPSRGCCNALRYADFGCICRNYGATLRSTPYAGCAMAIPSKCNIWGAPTSC